MKSPPFSPGASLVAYLRDSGHETQELSIQQQEQELLSWCQEHSFILARVYKDVGTGTSTAGRDQFKEMVHYLRSDQRAEEGLIVWKWNRFSRNIDESQFYRADLRRRGITLHSLNDDIPSGPEGRFFEAAIDWMNQSYIEDLKADTKRGLRNLVLNYGCIPGTPPMGFKREKVIISTHRDGEPHIAHRWIPDPDLVPLVQEAWQLRSVKTTYKEITDKTQLFRSKSSYYSFFRNPLFIGRLEYGDDIVIEEYCEPVISKEIWDKVQLLNKKFSKDLKDRKTPPGRRRGSGFLLAGLVYCARCGAPMLGAVHLAKGHRYHYYRCSRGHRRWDCDAPPIPKKILEDAVKNELIIFLRKPEAIVELQRAEREERERGQGAFISKRNALSAKIGGINRKISNVTGAIAELGHNQHLVDKLTDLDLQKSQIETLIAELDLKLQPTPEIRVDQIKNLSKMLEMTIKAAPKKQLKEIYKGLVNKILVDRGDKKNIQGQITFYLPGQEPPSTEEEIVCVNGLYPGREPYRLHKPKTTVPFIHAY